MQARYLQPGDILVGHAMYWWMVRHVIPADNNEVRVIANCGTVSRQFMRHEREHVAVLNSSGDNIDRKPARELKRGDELDVTVRTDTPDSRIITRVRTRPRWAHGRINWVTTVTFGGGFVRNDDSTKEFLAGDLLEVWL